jgi:iron complex transport system ATP-binding protein
MVLSDELIRLQNVQVWLEDGTQILRDVSWTVSEGEHWAVLGPNGAGKTTLFTVATARRYPSRGLVEVIGRRFGEADMLVLRQMISIVDPHQPMYEWFTVEEIVMTGVTGTIQPQPEIYTRDDFERARHLINQFGLDGFHEREIKSLSQGERQRVRLARALMTRPRVLVLDEPASGLDLPAREALIAAMTNLADLDASLATILITHHLEELPVSTTHALLLAGGQVHAHGPVTDVLTGEAMSATFGIPIAVDYREGRWAARGTASWTPARMTQG